MSKDKTETSKPYKNSETLYQEHNEIDWSSPNEENGYYPHGTQGSAWWLEERKKDRVQILVNSLLSSRAPFLLELPKDNPLASVLSNEEWQKARELAEEEHIDRALSMVEEFYKYAKFGEDKDLETAVQNTQLEDLEEYAKVLRDAALAFGDLAEGLERGRRRMLLTAVKGGHDE
jgi:hypothetical protein